MIKGQYYKVKDDQDSEWQYRMFSHPGFDGRMNFVTMDQEYLFPDGDYKTYAWEFFEEINDHDLQEGDLVDVSNSGETWSETQQIYLMRLKNGSHLCVKKNNEDYYLKGKVFDTQVWPFVKLSQSKITLTKADIAKKYNIPIDMLQILE